MDNDIPKPDQPEEEYQFQSAPETSSAFASATPEKTNIFDRIKRKNVLIIIGIIVVLIGLYKVVVTSFAPTTQHRPGHQLIATGPTKPTTPTVAPVVVAPPVVTEAPPTLAPAPVAQEAPVTGEIKDKLSALTDQANANQASLDRLNSQINDMQSALNNMSSQLSSMSDTVQNVANQWAADQAAKLKAKQTAAHMAKVTPKPVYYIRAMIPGRAWLLTQTGETITVSLGDNIVGYGTVQVIDPIQGIITTNTGAIIGYSPDDS